MKKLWLVALMIGLTPFAASARELKSGATRTLFACEGTAVSRVAARSNVAPCCEGRLQCPELLSTHGMIETQRRSRT